MKLHTSTDEIIPWECETFNREPRKCLSPAEEFCLDLLCCSARLLGNKSMKENQGNQTSGSAEIVAETRHEARKCPTYGKEYYRCQKKNHFGKVCRSDPKQGRKPYKGVETIRPDSSDDFVIDTVNFVYCQSATETEAIAINNILNGEVRVKLGTGAEVNVMSNRVNQTLATDIRAYRMLLKFKQLAPN